jgi:hypothetical protein
MTFDPSSRNRLSPYAARFFPGDTLFERLGRAVCEAGCLPRKELFEAWEVGKRVQRRTRGGRVVDLAAGHGLLAFVLLLLDPRLRGAVCVDRRRPASFAKLAETLGRHFQHLAGRVTYVEGDLRRAEVASDDLVVSVHACGGLTDHVLDVALAARARVAVLPCCHGLRKLDGGGLDGWLDGAVAIDVVRAMRLRQAGYRVWTGTIPADLTPQNRLLVGLPEALPA